MSIAITSLPAASALTVTELIPVVQSGVTKNAGTDQLAQLASLVFTLTGPISASGGVTSITARTGNGTTFAMQDSPSFTTPTIGDATATTVNKVSITQPATGATLTIADGATLATSGAYSMTLTATGATAVTLPVAGTLSTLAGSEGLTNKTYNGNTWTAGTGTLTIAASKTLTVNNSITVSGTDGTTMTFPSTSASIARTDAANTFTGTQTFSGLVSANLGVAVNSGSVASSGESVQLANLASGVAGRLQTNSAGTSFVISSYLDGTSLEISAGSSNKNGIYIGGQSATDGQVQRFYVENTQQLVLTTSSATVAGVFNGSGGIRVNGAFSLGATGQREFSFETPITRFYIGDGSGYSFAFSKRAASTTTDILTISDSTGAITATGVFTTQGAYITTASGTAIPAGGSAGTGYKFSSTSNFGMFFGSGAPSLSAAKGSLYLRSDGSGTTNRAYINTDGSTTWTAITTSA